MKPYVSTDLKDLNRRTVYNFIRNKDIQVVSRAEIAKCTKISGPTVLKIIGFFLEKNIVFELGETSNTNVGRNPTMLQFNSNAAYSVGVSYDGETLDIVLLNLNYEIVFSVNYKTDVEFSLLLKQALPQYIRSLLEKHYVTKDKILCIGIAVPCIVDTENYVMRQPNIKFNFDSNIDYKKECEYISAQFKCPVILENDVNSASIAEFRTLRKNQYDDLAYLLFDNGYGSALILDGKLRRGQHYAAGEIGFMVIPQKASLNAESCKYLEEFINNKYIYDHLNIDLTKKLSDTEAHAVVQYITPYLAQAIINMANILDIGYFVIGGRTFEKFKNLLLPQIREYLAKFCLRSVTLAAQQCMLLPVASGVASIAIDNTIDSFISN